METGQATDHFNSFVWAKIRSPVAGHLNGEALAVHVMSNK